MAARHQVHCVQKFTPTGCPLYQEAMQSESTQTTELATTFSMIQKLRDRGGESVRENPARSLHWWTSTEVAMRDQGNGQTPHTRHVRWAAPWPSANCHHVHDPQEWTPYTSDGKRVYPSKEEAEYIAVLAFAIAVSASNPGRSEDAGVYLSWAP